MDLSKLSDADLAAIQSGDMSKVSDEALTHISAPAAPEEPSLQGGRMSSIPGVGMLADLISPGFTKGAAHGAVDEASFGNVPMQDPSDSQAGRATGHVAGVVAKGAGGGAVVNSATSAAGRMGLSALVNGAQGALQKPEGEDSVAARAKSGGLAAFLGGGMQAVGEGTGKAGDWLMQKAVGMKKYIPGMGNRLADEGIIGTKGMMRGQVEKALPQREAELQDAVKQLQGKVEPEPVADALRSRASGYTPKPGPSGPLPVPSQNQPFVDAAHGRAEEALARGALAPEEALSVSRSVAKPAYSYNGEPLNSFKQQLSQTEGGSLKAGLKDLADQQNVPVVKDALAQEAALINAGRGLNKPESLQTVLGKMAIKAGIGGSLGYAADGTTGAVAGALASTPLGQSTAGRTAIGAAKAAPYVTPALIDALLSARKSEEQ